MSSEGSFLEEMNSFLDDYNREQDTLSGVAVIRPDLGEVEENLKKIYNKLAEKGVNLDELGDILEESKNMLIIAGAGAGKTTALILRIIVDLISGDAMRFVEVPSVYGRTQVLVPSNILVSTFLKTGAEELQRSFNQWCSVLGISGIDQTTIKFSTIHKDVKDAIEAMGVKVQIIEDTDKMIRTIMRSYNVKSNLSTSKSITVDEVRDIASLISYARNRLDHKRYEHPLMQEYSLTPIVLDAMLREFKLLRSATGCLDFEDMQEMLLEAAQNNPNVREFISNRYTHVYVDEFQDTSQLQYEILKHYFSGCKRVIVMGDEDQCLTPETIITTAEGEKQIKDVKAGDRVLSGVGRGNVGYHLVDQVSKKYVSTDIIVVKTESGKTIKGTPEHIGFARLEPNPEVHHVYLMYRNSIGFRIGATRGVRSGARQIIKNGVTVRLTQEKGDKVWIIHTSDDYSDVRFMESYFSYKYGIPQYVFEDSSVSKTGNTLTPERILELHEKLNTKEKGIQLLSDLGMDFEYPHFVPRAGSGRYKLNFSMFSSGLISREGIQKSELSASTMCPEYLKVLEKFLPITDKTTYHNNNPYWNARTTTSDTDRQLSIIKNIKNGCKDSDLYLEITRNAKFTEKKYDFMPLGNFVKGMVVPIIDGYDVIEDEVISVTREHYEGYVYDLSVPATRNFSANGILVHNCIYSWRGSDSEIITKKFRQDIDVAIKKLSTNYRCKSNILNAVIPSIEKNSDRFDKKLRSHKEGGEIHLIVGGDVNHMVTSVREDLAKNKKVGVLARTNADLLIPALILELDGGLEFGLSKAVNLYGRLPRQIYGIIDLVTKRMTPEFEGMTAFKIFDLQR